MIATTMEPTDGRRLLPSWDEPSFRARSGNCSMARSSARRSSILTRAIPPTRSRPRSTTSRTQPTPLTRLPTARARLSCACSKPISARSRPARVCAPTWPGISMPTPPAPTCGPRWKKLLASRSRTASVSPSMIDFVMSVAGRNADGATWDAIVACTLQMALPRASPSTRPGRSPSPTATS